MEKFCPYCGKEKIETVGISGSGTIYLCPHCKKRFSIR